MFRSRGAARCAATNRALPPNFISQPPPLVIASHSARVSYFVFARCRPTSSHALTISTRTSRMLLCQRRSIAVDSSCWYHSRQSTAHRHYWYCNERDAAAPLQALEYQTVSRPLPSYEERLLAWLPLLACCLLESLANTLLACRRASRSAPLAFNKLKSKRVQEFNTIITPHAAAGTRHIMQRRSIGGVTATA